MSVWLNLIGGFGLLLFGIKTMSEALQALAGDWLRRIIGGVGEKWRDAVAAGALVSAISVSSSATTVMVVSFVNAGLMTLEQAAGVILGANVGATVGSWLLALRLQLSALALVGGGALLNLFARRELFKLTGELALGAGLLFVGLSWLEAGFAPLRADSPLAQALAHLGADGFGGILLAVLIGVAVTAFVLSSGAMVGVTMALATVGLVSFTAAAALVIGVNIGGTMAAQRAAAEATTDSRRAAMLHTMVNVFGAIVVMCIFSQWIRVIDAVTPGNPEAFDAAGIRPAMAAHIAVAHTTFNVLMVALALPVLRPLVAIVGRLVGGTRRERPGLRYLRPSMVGSPALAIEQCRLEVLHMAAIAGEALHLTRQLLDDVSSPGSELRDQILKKERATDTMQHEITVFMSRVMAGPLTIAQSEESRALIRVSDEIESIADYCERLANYRRRLRREGMVLSSTALGELQTYLDRTITLYEDVIDRARRNETGWLAAIETKAEYLATEADALRDANLHRLATQRAAPGEGIFFNDLLVAMRRIRNHALNLAQAFLGKK